MLASCLLIASLSFQTVTQGLPRLDELEGFGSTSFQDFSFVQIGDPQIGYGSTWPAASRLKSLARECDALDAAFGIVVGDMVQDRTWFEKKLLRGALQDFSLPLTFIPGNHDVVDPSTLSVYRAEYGPDYYSFVYRGCGFIGLNSELYEEDLADREASEQWAWFEDELASFAQKQLRHLFLFVHRPPLSRSGGENEDDPLCSALREYGIQHVLAGHLHETSEIEARDAAFTVFTVGGTARVRDEHGYGYRVFDVSSAGVEQRYVAFDHPPDFWLARHGWSPRILDPSLTHWLLTLIFLVAARLCWRAFRGRDPEQEVGALWAMIAATYLFLGLNLQLDFDEIFAAVGRGSLQAMGLSRERRLLQVVILVGGALAFLVALLLGRRHLRGAGGRARLALLGLSLPVASFLLHALSLHQTETFLYLLGRRGLYFVEAAGAALTCWMAWRATRVESAE